jgi:hypothetical protein
VTPQRFLKDIPRVTPDGFWWAEQNENETLRFDLNYDLAESLSRREKARLGRELARRSVDLLERYVDEATSDISAYDVDEDPKGLVRWEEPDGRSPMPQSLPMPLRPRTSSRTGSRPWP